MARLRGRLRHGLAPWRARGPRQPAWPRARRYALWTERWRAPEARLENLERSLREAGAVVRRGGDFDRWDLEVRGGALGSTRLLTAVEEHGQGRQMVRGRTWPHVAAGAWGTATLLTALALAAGFAGSALAAGVLVAADVALVGRIAWECGRAGRAVDDAVARDLAADR
jgi:hypothetical protein